MAEINKSFRVNKGISLQDEVGIFYSTNDPAATSEVAPEGSLLLQKNSGSGVLWIKTGVADTAWKRLSELSLGDLEDVSISSIATNQLIRWNGSNFENATVSLNDLDGILSLAKGGLGSNVSGFDGTLIISGGTASSIKNNYSATSAPTGAHDSSAGYAIGSNWINISSGTAYICVDASIGAAVWTSSSAGSFSLDADSGTSQTIADGDTLTISGTANAIDTVVGATNTVTIDISNSYSGQTSITTLGTISTGTWEGTTIAVDQGGTGQTSYTDGQLLIGNSTGNTLSAGTISSTDASVTITNGNGTIDLAVNLSGLDHGTLTGLLHDDHTQYLLVDGSRAMSGSIDMGTNNITNVGTVDGVDISAHAADTSIHFTQASISITASQVSDFDTEVSNNASVVANTAKIGFTDELAQDAVGTILSNEFAYDDGTPSISLNYTNISHTSLQDIGTNTHAQIDTHIADSTLHFTEASIDHGSISGLSDDDHAQYALLAGRAGGQTLIGGANASDTLTLQSTSNATRGTVVSIDDFVIGGGTATSELRMMEASGNGSNYTGFKSPDSLITNIIYTLPDTEGSAGQMLTWNASNVLSWESAAGSGTMSSFNLTGDTGTTETVEDTETITISGTTNVIDTVSSSTNTITIDISDSYVGQTSITTLGTVSTGTWQGTTIAVDQGGTGQTSYTNGQLLIGNTTGNTLSLGTLASADSSITVTNGTGTIDLSVNGANISGVVHTTGAESIDGAKTFSSPVLVSASGLNSQLGTAGSQIQRNSTNPAFYVYQVGSGVIQSWNNANNPANVVAEIHNDGSVKTWGSFIVNGGLSTEFLKADGSVDTSTYALDSAVIHTTGAESASGVKTFSDNLKIGGGASPSELHLLEGSGSGSNYTGFKSPATLGTDIVYTLPSASGSAGQILTWNASNVLTWETASGTGTMNDFNLAADTGTPETIADGNTLTIAGTTNVIDTSVAATGTVTIDISDSYVGQTSITTLGTISTGTWQGTTIAVDQGGTGQTSYTNGQLLIGNTTGNTLSLGTLASADSSITITNGTGTIDLAVNDANVDHGSIGGLTDDDHTQYALLTGRSGGQTLIGGTAASNTLTLQSTSDATRGTINIVDNVIIGGGTSPSELRLLEGSASGTNYTGFKSPTTLSSNVVYELPSASGTDGQVMAWSSGDVMEWTDRVSSSATNKVTTISVVSTLPGTPDANTLYFVMSA